MDPPQGASKEEQNSEEPKVAVTEPMELTPMTKDIKDDLGEQGQGKDQLTINSKLVSCITPTRDHPSKEVAYKGTRLIFTDNINQGSVNQNLLKVEEEQGQVDIEDFNLVGKEIDHPMDLIIMPLPRKSNGSSEDNNIV